MQTDDDFDFTKPEAATPAPSAATAPPKPVLSRYYDAEVAKRFFEVGGRLEGFPAGTTLFVENEKSGKQGLFGKRVSHRMYLITEGAVALSLGGKSLDTIKAGEVFGEMAVISETPAGSTRSATAIAQTDCKVYSLDTEELQAALARTPEFALMLMSVMFDRLRFLAARLAARKTAVAKDGRHESPVFDADALANLEATLERATTIRYQAGKVVMNEGDAGTNMYIVLEGRVAISIKGRVVESVGSGGTFGEMALVDQSPRTASAVAENDCALLAIHRAALIALVKNQPAVGITMLRPVAARLRYMNALLA